MAAWARATDLEFCKTVGLEGQLWHCAIISGDGLRDRPLVAFMTGNHIPATRFRWSNRLAFSSAVAAVQPRGPTRSSPHDYRRNFVADHARRATQTGPCDSTHGHPQRAGILSQLSALSARRAAMPRRSRP